MNPFMFLPLSLRESLWPIFWKAISLSNFSHYLPALVDFQRELRFFESALGIYFFWRVYMIGGTSSINCFKFMKGCPADKPRQQRHHQRPHVRAEYRGCGQVPLLPWKCAEYSGFRDEGRVEARHIP